LVGLALRTSFCTSPRIRCAHKVHAPLLYFASFLPF
jgi:hypothetical protein